MEDIEVPHYFTCPISLQIMKDPVTVITGITYDRDSIEHWLFKLHNQTCPVTKQPLPLNSDLTPNHNLRRLIQSWCTQNSARGINRIPTPKPPLTKDQILKLLKDLTLRRQPQIKIIKQLQNLAAENGRNSQLMAETGVFEHMLCFIVTCVDDQNNHDQVLITEALSIINLLRPRISPAELDRVRARTDRVMDSLAWILGCSFVENHVKGEILTLLKLFIENYSNPSELGRLNRQFFEYVVGVLKGNMGNNDKFIDIALEIIMRICPLGRNRVTLVESGAVFELVDIGFGSGVSNKRIEIVLGVLFQLCCCAEGRAEFLRHKGSIFFVSNRIFRLSSTADDRAVKILSLICRFSGTKQVVQEMVEVGAVLKLCVLLQTHECDDSLKEKAREILKSHYEEWKNSPCVGDHYPYLNSTLSS
ncbi:E3 ubiquitin-protein ligase PUB24-like [Cannabis sativa]|uniref:E3 ubiquitin-protein ligase PUB24-like n=1 Tax=Cannabis sativa TaxID=3483 RepID=UPI0029C9F2BE|nr:E3 ubiquitin-protein ligase PUB24-like [Cannabis sativa]